MEIKARCKALSEQGLSLRQIAKEVGVSKTTVATHIKSFLNPKWVEVGGENNSPADLYGAIPNPTFSFLLTLNTDTVHDCVSWVANAVAKSKLNLLVKTLPGQKAPRCPVEQTKSKNIQRVSKHPLLSLLEHPNHNLSKYDFLYYTDTQLSLTGNAYAHIVREDYKIDKYGQPVVNDGLPTGLWSLMTQHVEQKIEHGKVVGYKYNLGNEAIMYPEKDIIHFKLINPENPYGLGYGPVRAVYERIILGKNELAYLNSLFRNQSRPDSLITLKGGATADQCERMQKEINARFKQGGIGGPWVVDGEDIEIHNLSWAPKDMLGEELYRWTKEQIVNAFGLNLALFTTESSNRAVATQARRMSQEQAVAPRLRLIEERLNHQLIPEFDERLFVEFDSPVEADEEMQLKKLSTYSSSKILTINEARKLLDMGLEPLEDGDVLITPEKDNQEGINKI